MSLHSTTAASLQLEARPASAPDGSLGRPGLAAVHFDAGGDGVAYVARLLALALEQLGAPAQRAELRPRGGQGPGILEIARFSIRVVGLQASRVDWILYSHLGLARVHRYVPRRWRRPYAVFLHGIEVWDADLAEDRLSALRGAALRIANSSYTAERVGSVLPEVGPIAACPLSLHPDDCSSEGDVDLALVGQLGVHSVLIIGRMSAEERYKGHDELIECWGGVLRRVPDAQLVVVGTGNDRDRLRQKAATAGLQERVVFTGFVNDATRDALLARSTIFAMPSRGEGFGIVYLQAMRAGKACIGSRFDAARDVIVDGESGLLVDPGNADELVSAIASLLEDDVLRARMGAAGRRRFEAEFTFDRFRDRLATLLAGAFGDAVEQP